MAFGGLVALLDHSVEQLRASGRIDSPQVQSRLGQAIIARETSRLWVQAAARVAEDPTADSACRPALNPHEHGAETPKHIRET